VVGVQESNDFRMSFFPVMILENLHRHARRIVLPEMRSYLDRAVDRVIVLHKSADETDDDDWRSDRRSGDWRRIRVWCTDRACRDSASSSSEEAKNKRNTTD
jgi:hypothetical protein